MRKIVNMSKRVCKTLNLSQRVDVLERLQRKESQTSIASLYGVNQSQISRIQKNRDNIIDEWQRNSNPDRKRKRVGKSEDVEEGLLRWFSQARAHQLPISGPLLMQKAEKLAQGLGFTDFKATSGWLERWKTRNSIQFKKQHGEKQDADDYGAERWTQEILPGILKEYRPQDIFNADETGLYWRAIPDGTLTFKGVEAPGSKIAKDRMTLLLACNMDGSEKIDPLTIGKSKNPRCFKNVKTLPVDYKANKNAWMTADIWKEWLQHIDNKMRSKGRRIVMLCDNCAAHANDVKLTNVKLVFLPPNTTSLIQPMDQGIIANFKKQYRSLVLQRLVADIDTDMSSAVRAAEVAKKLTLLDSLHMQREAWNKITKSTMSNCYRKASFLLPIEEIEGENDNEVSLENGVYVPPGMATKEFERYAAVDNDLATEADISESAIVSAIQLCDNQPSDNSEDDDDDVATQPASFAVAKQSLENIRRFLEQKGCESYESFYQLEATVVKLHRDTAGQSSIYDFFSRA